MTVSVIIPSTSSSDSLETAIRSVYQQSVAIPIEVIVVYNNLTEELTSKNSITNRLEKNSRITVEEIVISNEENANANTARNRGTSKAKGDFIAYLDSDDIWYPDHLEQRVNALSGVEVDAAFGPFHINRGGRLAKRTLVKYKTGSDPFEFIWANGGLTQTSGFLVRREMALKSKWDENLKRSQDHDFFVRVSQVGQWAQIDSHTYEVLWPQFKHRAYNFDSYWQFYTENRERFSDESACNYLFSRLLESAFSKDSYFGRFKSEIKKRNSKISFLKKIIGFNRTSAVSGWYINQIFN